MVWDEKYEAWEVFEAELDAHVCVDQVHLGYKYRSVGQVCVHNIGGKTPESPPKMDGVQRGLAAHGIIKTTEGVVVDEPRLEKLLGYGTNGTESEVGKVDGKVQW